MKAFLLKHWHIILFSVGGPVVGLIAGVIYYNLASEPSFAIMYGITLLITVICHVAFTTVIIAQKTDEVKEKIGSTSSEFKNFMHQSLKEHMKIKVLSDIEADSAIRKSLLNADGVKNSYVNISSRYGSKTELGREIVSMYKDFLSRSENHVWEDITTYGEVQDGRFYDIHSSSEVKGRHLLHIIDGHTDIINFLILEKERVPTDVFFGWIANSNDRYRIFHTTNHDIVSLFQDHFSKLKIKSIEDVPVAYKEGSLPAISLSSQLVGKWISVSVIKNNSSVEDYERYSVLNISIDDGVWTVSISVYDRKSNSKVSVINALHTQAYGRAIFYEFSRRTVYGDMEEEGLGTYSVTEISSDIISGTYVIPIKNKLLKTFATKMSDEDAKKKQIDKDLALKYMRTLIETRELGLTREI